MLRWINELSNKQCRAFCVWMAKTYALHVSRMGAEFVCALEDYQEGKVSSEKIRALREQFRFVGQTREENLLEWVIFYSGALVGQPPEIGGSKIAAQWTMEALLDWASEVHRYGEVLTACEAHAEKQDGKQ